MRFFFCFFQSMLLLLDLNIRTKMGFIMVDACCCVFAFPSSILFVSSTIKFRFLLLCVFYSFFVYEFSGFIVKCLSYGLKKMMKIVICTQVHDDGERRRAEQSINEFQ